MASVLLRILLALLFCMMILQKSDAQLGPQWCVADEQTPDEVLQKALDWACGRGGADCRKIQKNQPCYFPNTLKDHASYAFNSYWQKFKNVGGSCYFSAAAMVTDLDPSHDSCRFEFRA
ncbi:carbohydrate-binding X8 domain superfamily protein [Tasmannia lanceolata]|uniref:carbohydrate-binding X8 domain superfamily protein n=1 Tax=Tasmannia lanceolata TaxID=3420 RepID=UPI0040643179